MALLGRLFRALLNINTIWGLMIVSAFALCVVQHYLPTRTVLPEAALAEASNTFTIRVTGPAGKTAERTFTLAPPSPDHVGDVPLDAPLRERRDGGPWLIRAALYYVMHDDFRGKERCWLLTWDYDGHGRYEVLAGDQVRARGRLVTLPALTEGAFQAAQDGFDIALKLVATMVLFLGLMKVGEDAGVVQALARAVHPLMRLLFPNVPREHPASGALVMNMTTTVLGLGNAATPFGLKAMEELQKLNPHKHVASDAQVMLLGYNTAGFALLPTMLLALRKSAGCRDPFEIIGTCMFAGAVSTITAILMVRLLGLLPMFSVRAALAESAPQSEPRSVSERAASSDPRASTGGSPGEAP